jgi:hypothetical protein
MAGVYAVIGERQAAWNWSQPMEGQREWPEHAAYMDELVDRGFIALGGPLDDGANGRVLLIVRAASVDEIHATLAEDPWSDDLLRTTSVETWTLRLGELR